MHTKTICVLFASFLSASWFFVLRAVGLRDPRRQHRLLHLWRTRPSQQRLPKQAINIYLYNYKEKQARYNYEIFLLLSLEAEMRRLYYASLLRRPRAPGLVHREMVRQSQWPMSGGHTRELHSRCLTSNWGGVFGSLNEISGIVVSTPEQ